MGNPSNVRNISETKPSLKEVLATIERLKAEAEKQIKEANALAEQHASEFAEQKSKLRETAVDAVHQFKAIASPEEFSQFRRDLGMGRKGGKRESKPCSVCGQKRHSKDSTCSGRK